jgi:hypothetical protein
VDATTKKTFKLKQDGAWKAKYLTVVSPTFEPNTKDAIGRFYFQPNFKAPATVWPGSEFEYTFGTHAFGAEATCQVVKGTTAPGTVMSDAVSVCLISSAKIKITMAKAISSVDFFVVINRASAWAGAGTVTATLTSYALADIQKTDLTDGEVFTMAAATLSSTTKTEVAVVKTCVNTMDTGSVKFTVTLKTLASWGMTGRAYVDFPNYYRPNLGRMVTCAVEGTDGTVTEAVFCETRWDHSLTVYGPKSAAIKIDTAFVLAVYGVNMNDQSTV